MFPRTLPARIVSGFVLMIAFAILLGGVSLWRITEINRNVEIVATNSVPSIVALTRVIQSTYDSTRAVRRMLLATTDGSPAAKSDDMGFKTARSEGDEACKAYTALFTDPEEERLFTIARSARESYLRSVERVVALLQEGKAAEARALMRDEVDGFHDACITAFNEAIRHNVGVAAANADEARRNVARSFGLVGGTLALAMLLGALLAAGIIRSTTRALGGVSAALESTSTQTSLAASQLATSSHALAEGCSEQGSAVEETSAALEQMSAMIRATSDNADKAKLLANQARGAAQGGLGTMQEMNDAMQAIEASSQEVAKIVRNIDEIAFQTNILALNAAVEAARAGEAGAGFAVVADEVRSLAQRSAAAAQETARKIEAAIATSRRGAASCDRVGESLEEITRRVSAVDGLVAEIATAAKEQAQGIQQVTMAMAQMDQVTQGNSASAEQSAGAAEQLKAQSRVMRDTVASLQSLAGRREARRHVFDAPDAPVPRIEWRAAGVAPRQTTRIPMPKEPPPAADHEDRHFRNF